MDNVNMTDTQDESCMLRLCATIGPKSTFTAQMVLVHFILYTYPLKAMPKLNIKA